MGVLFSTQTFIVLENIRVLCAIEKCMIRDKKKPFSSNVNVFIENVCNN
jgi:hypothetical protein